MFRAADLLLLVVIFSSMFTGVAFPEMGRYFQPYPLYCMMFLLFLSFLSLDLATVGRTLRNHISMAIWLTFFKLLLLPIFIFLILKVACPRFATAGLLLSGVSTGVVAPFIATLVRSNGALVLLMVVVTSLLVPFTLPLLVEVFVGRALEISLLAMIELLSLIVFVPILAVEMLRKWLPGVLGLLLGRRYPISLVMFAVINLGVFSKYAGYFRQQPGILLSTSVVALALGGTLFILGIVSALRAEPEDRVASAIVAGNMNNVLIIVFSSRFFGPLEATVAAMYMIPFFLILLPLRVCEQFWGKSFQALS
ncbi:MAG: bile acid:sodium symporter [Deltaproteobacteria bacterium]|nr:MAG: bile acid:sodium symporter [Deltaproteobacteria bacterium]